MKSVTLAVFTMVIGLALSGTVFAQGRHDEKPHGMMKNPPAEVTDKDRYAGSGRHDEKPHGMTKPAVKKDTTKSVDDKAGK